MGAAAESGEKPPRLTRREMLENEGAEIEMPPLEWGEYLVAHLFEFGPTVAAGMGSAPVGAGELESWSRLTGISLSPWEARTLLRLSREYLGESHRATEQNCPAPWQPETYQPEKTLAVIEQRNAFRSLAKL